MTEHISMSRRKQRLFILYAVFAVFAAQHWITMYVNVIRPFDWVKLAVELCGLAVIAYEVMSRRLEP